MRSGGHRVFTLSVVVIEVTSRGAQDAPTNRVLAGVEVIGVDEQLARAEGSGVVLTGDVDDLGRLASATGQCRGPRVVSVEAEGGGVVTDGFLSDDVHLHRPGSIRTPS